MNNQTDRSVDKKSTTLPVGHLVAIGFIFTAVTVAWLVLGGTLTKRTGASNHRAKQSVTHLWGPEQSQTHPSIWYYADAQESRQVRIQPSSGQVDVKLTYEPKKKGLSWQRTYQADFAAAYQISNPTASAQKFYVSFPLPSENSSYYDFSFQLGDQLAENAIPVYGEIKQSVTIPAGEKVELKVSYLSRGMDHWQYHLGNAERIRNFQLNMVTNFEEIDFLDGSCSPTARHLNDQENAWSLRWDYPDVIRPQSIGMDMPMARNPGPVAAKITFFAPFSLLFFFACLIVFGLLKGITLHPMNYVFLAAGFFAFHLLFAYLVDLVPLHLSFLIASIVSLGLIASYVRAVGGKQLMWIAIPAQLAYLVLFSYSFLFNGITGLTITLGAITTLGLLMTTTAKIDWAEIFASRKTGKSGLTPPPAPSAPLPQ
ncbi:MAG: inner membrane CreD family protein [Akkermansiaceae bacterium]|nr:inner membrane CreD family protein [Akkermansiaceae bacterium]